MFKRFGGKFIDSSEHPAKDIVPIEVTLDGIETEVRDKNLKNTPSPIDVIPSEMIIFLTFWIDSPQGE